MTYPETEKLGRHVVETLQKGEDEIRLLAEAKEYVGEYEHGSVDVEDVAGVTLEQLRSVIEDFVLFVNAV